MADIELQEESFKRAERARQRNKIEDRKLDHQLNRKHGMHETHRYRIQVMSEERRLIEKELKKIKTGIRKAPAQDPFEILTPEGQDQTPRGGGKNNNPGKIRGRAMSIHDQSDKYNFTPQAPVAYDDGASQDIATNPLDQPRRQSLIPTLQHKTEPPRRASLAQNANSSKSPLRPNSEYVTGNPRRPYLIPRAQPVTRRQSQLLSSQPAVVESPSVNDLMQTAMKNAVMYAVKHVEKLKIDENDDDDDNDNGYDDYDSDEDHENTSQYRRGFVVVTKEGHSDEEDDDFNAETRSIKTIATRRSEPQSLRSIYDDFDDEDSDSDSPATHRPMSRTSTALTSVSQVTNIRAVAARRRQKEVVSNTPRSLATSLSLPKEKTSTSLRSTSQKTNNSASPGDAVVNPDKTPRKTKKVPISQPEASSRDRGAVRKGNHEPTSSSFNDANSAVSGVSKKSQTKKKSVQIADETFVADSKPRSKKDSSVHEPTKPASSYPKSGSSRRSDVSPLSMTSRRSTNDVSDVENETKGSINKPVSEKSSTEVKSARSTKSLHKEGADDGQKSARSVASSRRENKGIGSEKKAASSEHLPKDENTVTSKDSKGKQRKTKQNLVATRAQKPLVDQKVRRDPTKDRIFCPKLIDDHDNIATSLKVCYFTKY